MCRQIAKKDENLECILIENMLWIMFIVTAMPKNCYRRFHHLHIIIKRLFIFFNDGRVWKNRMAYNFHEEKSIIKKLEKEDIIIFSLVWVHIYFLRKITTNLLTHSRFYSWKKKEHNVVKRLKIIPFTAVFRNVINYKE